MSVPQTVPESSQPGDTSPTPGREEAAPRSTRQSSFEAEAIPHLRALHSYALRLLSGDEARADDAVQNTYLRAYRSWHTYRPGTNCRAWLMTILRNVVFEKHAADVRTRDLDEHVVAHLPAFTGIADLDPEASFFDGIVDEAVLEAIDGLPLLHREVFVLRDIEGLRYAEMARVLEVPLGTVKSRLSRARKALQRELYDYAVAEGYVRPRAVAESA